MPDYAGRPSKKRKKEIEKAKKEEEEKAEEEKNSKRRPTRVMGVPILVVLATILHLVSAISAVFFLTILLGILNALLVLIYVWVAYNIFIMRPTAWALSLILNCGLAIFNLFYLVVFSLMVNLVTVIILVLPSVQKEFGR
ncbi:MAG: hypothetical protein ACFFBJ_01975 [Promethearchaeota archaeon]